MRDGNGSSSSGEDGGDARRQLSGDATAASGDSGIGGERRGLAGGDDAYSCCSWFSSEAAVACEECGEAEHAVELNVGLSLCLLLSSFGSKSPLACVRRGCSGQGGCNKVLVGLRMSGFVSLCACSTSTLASSSLIVVVSLPFFAAADESPDLASLEDVHVSPGSAGVGVSLLLLQQLDEWLAKRSDASMDSVWRCGATGSAGVRFSTGPSVSDTDDDDDDDAPGEVVWSFLCCCMASIHCATWDRASASSTTTAWGDNDGLLLLGVVSSFGCM